MSSLHIQVCKNKSWLCNSTEDMQMATDGYLGQHQHYMWISGLLALWIWPDGVCILRNLWWEPHSFFLFPDDHEVEDLHSWSTVPVTPRSCRLSPSSNLIFRIKFEVGVWMYMWARADSLFWWVLCPIIPSESRNYRTGSSSYLALTIL